MTRWMTSILASALLATCLLGCSDDSEPLDPSQFLCGDQRCVRDAEFCVFNGSDIAGEPGFYQCEALPQECLADVQCACLDGLEAPGFNLQFCLDTGGCEAIEGGFRVTCPGG